jgi:cysteine synthase B
MGIAYASFCAALGIPVHLMVPANASPERLALLRILGARLTLTDPLEGTDGAQEAAVQEAALHPERYFYADQYSNPGNWRAHYETTGPEILDQTDGRLTHLVAGLGTTGTLTGIGRFFHDAGHPARLVAVQPDGPLHGLEGLKHLATSPVPSIFDPTLPDATITVRTEEAHQMARRLAREEGLLVGVSAAAAIVASLRVADGVERGVIVAILPDSAFKYLSERFWSDE